MRWLRTSWMVLIALQAGLNGAGGAESVGAPTSGADWPQWMGPERDGTSPEKGLLREWPKDGPEVSWRVPLGMGISSPSVYDGKIYVHSLLELNPPQASDAWKAGTAVTYSQALVCLDLETGLKDWQFNYNYVLNGDPQVNRRKHFGPYATPCVTERAVYLYDSFGNAYALERATGKEIWRRDLAADLGWGGYLRRDKGFASSPLVVEKIVVFNIATSPDLKTNRLAGLDAETGKDRWQFSAPHIRGAGESNSGWQTPQVATLNGKEYLVFYVNNSLKLLDPITGVEAFSHDTVSPGKGVDGQISTVTVVGNQVLVDPGFADCNAHTAYLLEIDAQKTPFAGKVLWKCDVGSFYTPWLYRDGYFYGLDSKRGTFMGGEFDLTCIDAKTGEIKCAKEKIPQSVALAQADGLIFVHAFNTLRMFECSPNGIVEKGSVPLERFYDMHFENYMKGCSMPVISRGRLLVRSTFELICFKVK